MYEPPYTEKEARSEGFELEDYETEILTVWPDNEQAMALFNRIGSRWMHGMNGVTGIRWEAVYPLMDRMGLESEAWDDLLSDLEVMESAALAVINKKD